VLNRVTEGPVPVTIPTPTRILGTKEEVALLESDISILSYLRAIVDA
jgi:hypothetical protein